MYYKFEDPIEDAEAYCNDTEEDEEEEDEEHYGYYNVSDHYHY